ncbi:hypothetical protein, partial [Mesorhizobium sp. M7A.F.Ca.CA.001.13.1.1]
DKDMSIGIFAQSVGGSGGDGGFAMAAGAFAAVGIGGKGGAGGAAGEVEVKNTTNITTVGSLSHGILAQSVGRRWRQWRICRNVCRRSVRRRFRGDRRRWRRWQSQQPGHGHPQR